MPGTTVSAGALVKTLEGLHRLSCLRSLCSFSLEFCSVTILPEDHHRPNQAKPSALASKNQTQLRPPLHTEALTNQTGGSPLRVRSPARPCACELALLSLGWRCSEERAGGVLGGLRGQRKHV